MVGEFIAASEKNDLDTALALLSPEIEYQNMPMPAVHGVAQVRSVLEAFMGGATEMQWVVHHQLAGDGLVLNERTDRFLIDGRWLEIPVAGVFHVNGGRITLWRDYFDLPTVTNQMTAAPPAG